MINLYDMISAAYLGDETLMLTLIDKFNPLLKKYAHQLNYDFEDAYEDMLLAFIGLIRSPHITEITWHNDGSIVVYIQKAMCHSYILLSKKHRKNTGAPLDISIKDTSIDAYTVSWDNLCASEDNNDWEIYDFLYSHLGKRDAEILVLILHDSCTIQEIARKYDVAPSIISRAKKRALAKLQKLIQK